MLRLPALHQHRAAAAEQRNGVRLLDQPRRIGGELLALDAHKRERIVGIVDRGAHQRVDALAHQPGVRPEHQHDRLRRIGPGDEAIDVGGFDGGHFILSCPAEQAGPGSSTRSVSISEHGGTGRPLSRGRQLQLRPRDEIRRQARADVVRDHLGGAVLGVAQAAVAGEALLLAGNVVGHAREGLPADDRLAGRDLGQRVGGVDAVVLPRPAARC